MALAVFQEVLGSEKFASSVGDSWGTVFKRKRIRIDSRDVSNSNTAIDHRISAHEYCHGICGCRCIWYPVRSRDSPPFLVRHSRALDDVRQLLRSNPQIMFALCPDDTFIGIFLCKKIQGVGVQGNLGNQFFKVPPCTLSSTLYFCCGLLTTSSLFSASSSLCDCARYLLFP